MEKGSSIKIPTGRIPASGIRSRIVRVADQQARRSARYVGRRLNRLAPRKIKAGVVVFVIIGSAYSLYTAWHSMTEGGAKTLPPVQLIHAPLLEKDRPDTVNIKDALLNRAMAFKQYADSLRRVQGRRRYDSLSRATPGLLDSLQRLQDIMK